MKKIPMLEKFAAQSLVEVDSELIFSKERFAELIVRECADHIMTSSDRYRREYFADKILKHFGVKE